jgi:hypothetical protein
MVILIFKIQIIFTVYFHYIKLKYVVPINKKLGENVKARLLENEGLYIGRKPYVKIKNKNLMENRMLKFPDSVMNVT